MRVVRGKVGKLTGKTGLVETVLKPSGILGVRFEQTLWWIEPSLVESVPCSRCGGDLHVSQGAEWCSNVRFEKGTIAEDSPCDYALMSGQSSMMNIIEIESLMKRMLVSGKPKVIAGVFSEKNIPLDENKARHFKTQDYLWRQDVQPDGRDFAGHHMGVCMDESLNYVHIVMATPEFLRYVLNLKKFEKEVDISNKAV